MLMKTINLLERDLNIDMIMIKSNSQDKREGGKKPGLSLA